MESELPKVTKLRWHVFLKHVQSTRLTDTRSSLQQSKVMWYHQGVNMASQTNNSYGHLPSGNLTKEKLCTHF